MTVDISGGKHTDIDTIHSRLCIAVLRNMGCDNYDAYAGRVGSTLPAFSFYRAGTHTAARIPLLIIITSGLYPDRGGYKQREEQRYLLFPHQSGLQLVQVS